ncbi:hypothetical protein BGZ94_004999, partial [Podila epigama]
MKSPLSLSTLALSSTVLLLLSSTKTAAKRAIFEDLETHDNFIVAHGWGPDRWGCSFTRTQVHETEGGTNITIGKDSNLKPYSCGELIHRKDRLGYGVYSIEMIASNVVGQVTSFFLIANEDTEIDIELTGLNNRVGWMNVWNNHKQNPVSIDLPFDTSKEWHKYSFEWRKDFIAWSIDGNVVLNRSDVATTAPENANYKLVINSWTQVQPEINIDWAGKFVYPKDGRIPHARFRNMRYQPKIYGPGEEEQQRLDEAEEDRQEEEERLRLRREAEKQEEEKQEAARRAEEAEILEDKRR